MLSRGPNESIDEVGPYKFHKDFMEFLEITPDSTQAKGAFKIIVDERTQISRVELITGTGRGTQAKL